MESALFPIGSALLPRRECPSLWSAQSHPDRPLIDPDSRGRQPSPCHYPPRRLSQHRQRSTSRSWPSAVESCSLAGVTSPSSRRPIASVMKLCFLPAIFFPASRPWPEAGTLVEVFALCASVTQADGLACPRRTAADRMRPGARQRRSYCSLEDRPSWDETGSGPLPPHRRLIPTCRVAPGEGGIASQAHRPGRVLVVRSGERF
jgi:hypothetical protein